MSWASIHRHPSKGSAGNRDDGGCIQVSKPQRQGGPEGKAVTRPKLLTDVPLARAIAASVEGSPASTPQAAGSLSWGPGKVPSLAIFLSAFLM